MYPALVKASFMEMTFPAPARLPGRDGDGRAVHVHFSLPNFVEPGPSQSVVRRCNLVWYRVLEFVGSVSSRVGSHIARVGGWAAALDGLDDLEDGVLGGRYVLCQADLAGSPTMGCLPLEAQRLRATDGHDIPLHHVPVLVEAAARKTVLAGIVGAVFQQRIGVGRWVAVRDWLLDPDMSESRGKKNEQGPGGQIFSGMTHVV